MTPKKLLIQSYKFPPTHSVGTQRVYQFYRSFNQVFEEVLAITTENRKLFPADSSLSVLGDHVYEIPTNDLRSWLLRNGRTGTHLSPAEKKRFDAFGLRKLYHSFPFVKYFGDGGIKYIRKSCQQAARLIEERGVTHILTSYRPWSDHIVGHYLKKKFPHLVWIADFRDFPVDKVRKDVWWPALQRRYLKKYLQRVDVLTTVSDGLAKQFQAYHNNVVVVRNGLATLPSQFMTAPMDGQFSITYTGSLYPGLQCGKLFMESLRELLNEDQINPVHLQIRYAGKDSHLWHQWLLENGLSHFNKDHGLLPLSEAQTLQRKSQLNLLLSWSAENYGGIMTAKLAHYLSAGRPIIATLNGPEDPEISKLIVDTGAGKVFANQTAGSRTKLKAFILQCYQTWAFSSALPWQIPPANLLPYTWEQQFSDLQKHL